MVLEIERRYLISGGFAARLAVQNATTNARGQDMEQGYFPTVHGTSLRVRLIDGRQGVITYKVGEGRSREETEVEIDWQAARKLHESCPYKLRKIRRRLGRFEIDFLCDELNGITLVEIELTSPDETFEMPEWLKGAVEVTESVNNLALAKLASKLGDKLHDKPLLQLMRPPLPLIALTGGPCSGKTEAIKLLKNKLGHKIRVVPEAARFLIEELGIRPNPSDKLAYANFQEKLFITQRTLEEAALDDAWSQGQKAVIADRGTLDSLAYLDGGEKEFERMTGGRVANELARYTRVIHLATAPQAFFKNDTARKESYDEARKLGALMQIAWSGHSDLRFAKLENWDHKMAQITEYVLDAIKD